MQRKEEVINEKSESYREPHFKWIDQVVDENGLITLGPLTSASFITDPKSLLFRAARYKFVAKMLEGQEEVLEIGCGDASMSPIVKQVVHRLTAIDNDQKMISYAIENNQRHFDINFKCIDIVGSNDLPQFNAVYSLDVLEHIPPQFESDFLSSCVNLLKEDGIFIVGTPSLAAQKFTTDANKEGHVNCKSNSELRDSLRIYFANVFTFGMNDEMLHTGFSEFRNYLFAICTNPRKLVQN